MVVGGAWQSSGLGGGGDGVPSRQGVCGGRGWAEEDQGVKGNLTMGSIRVEENREEVAGFGRRSSV